MSLTSEILHKMRRAARNKQGSHFTADELRHLAGLGVLHLLFQKEADELMAGWGIKPVLEPDTPEDELPNVFSVKTLAHRWRCSDSLIRKMIATGELKHFRHGPLIRIPVEAVLERERVSPEPAA